MRNDARPIGEDAGGESPIDGREAVDERESVTHDRQSHIINKRAEEDVERDKAPSDRSERA